MEADLARNFHAFYERGRDRLSESLRGQIERGRRVTAVDYNNAVDRRMATALAFDEVFDRCDAILTAAAAGPAPRGLASTGSPAFCTLWTFAGMPAVTLPLLRSRERPADGHPARRPAWRRRAPAAHRALAGRLGATARPGLDLTRRRPCKERSPRS